MTPKSGRNEEQEREANEFAMCLLMPKTLVEQWLASNQKEWFYTEDDLLKEIARVFGVSITVAAIRLTKLGYWRI